MGFTLGLDFVWCFAALVLVFFSGACWCCILSVCSRNCCFGVGLLLFALILSVF